MRFPSVNRLKRLAAIVLVVLFASKSFGQGLGQNQYLVDQWTSDDGLPDTSVTAVARTGDGYTWIGTYNGLSRFDGVRFVNFDPFNTPALQRSRVSGLFVDNAGTLWINTYDGSMTSFRDGKFIHEWKGGTVANVFANTNQTVFALENGQLAYRLNRDPKDWHVKHLNSSALKNCFQTVSGEIWLLFADGKIARFAGTNEEILPRNQIGLPRENINCLAADKNGRIWAGTDNELDVWDGHRFENATPTNGESNLNVSFIFCARDNSCWVFANKRLRKCVNRQWISEVEANFSESEISNAAAIDDGDGGLWFKNLGSGLLHVMPDGKFEWISTHEGLPDNRISCWLDGSEGNLWLGTYSDGLVRLRKRQFEVIGTSNNNPAISSICEDAESNIWIGTYGDGLNRFKNGNLKKFDLNDGLDRGFFFSLYPDKNGRIWFSAGKENLYFLQNGQITQLDKNINDLNTVFVDRDDRVWLGMQSGLKFLTNGIPTDVSSDEKLQTVRAITQDRQGNLWIGTRYGDLYEFKDGKFTHYRATDALQNQAICTLLPDDDGTLWIGTFRGGLLKFHDGNFTRYTTHDGLPDDIIGQILDDKSGNLWFGSHNGIFRISKKSLREFDDGKIKSLPCACYGQYDGLPTRECSSNYQPASWRSHDGTLWFATLNGAVAVRPETISNNPIPPKVAIEEVYVDGKLFADNVHPAAQNAGARSNESIRGLAPETILSIPPGRHQIEFRYTALTYTAPESARFRYELSGHDAQWIQAGTRRFADFGPLSPGKYSFHVLACNSDAVWNLRGATIRFQVLPFFWQTWWFNGLLGIAVTSLAFAVARFIANRKLRVKLAQTEQDRAVFRDRERIARDIHDDIGAGLTQIALRCSLARREPPQNMPEHLTQISETAHELVRGMNEIVWAVNPENDTLEGLVTYIGKFTQDYLALAGMRCRLDLPPQLPAMNLSAEVRHNLFLAIKETLNNAIKHAGATEISLQLKLQPEDGFTFIIHDNGRGLSGRDTAETTNSFISTRQGLRNLVRRLEAIGGQCIISSERDGGTRVELMFVKKS
ncbi:MAG TPA: two-component regulator propeller domain-containing protein [Verrucomicrobiae bacterium]|nr:two-component regulator propeller domain-containing protein [Verrucomicrobiae bacterium]